MQTLPFEFTLFTNDPGLAAEADEAGIDRIGIDLDRLGKTDRQSPAFRISNHADGDLDAIGDVVKRGRLFARTDPIHAGLSRQIDELIARGAEVLMLPMFRSRDDVERFVDMVGGRATVSVLVETAAAAVRIHEVVCVEGIDEVFVGLNDLHLSLGLDSRFEVISSGLMDAIAREVHAAGLRFGFGGVGRATDRSLPVPSALVYPQYARLGARGAIIARSFLGRQGERVNLREAVMEARAALAEWEMAPPDVLDAARDRLRAHLKSSIPATASIAA